MQVVKINFIQSDVGNENINYKALPGGNKVVGIISKYIIPILFAILLLSWSLLTLFPSFLNSVLPCDSQQTVRLKNNQNKSQKIVILGRLSYTNSWIPIVPITPILQFTSLINLNLNESKTLTIRTGTKDVDHMLVTNLTDSNYKLIDKGIITELPKNEILIYSNILNPLHNKPPIYLFSLIFNVVLYLVGLAGCISFWLSKYFTVKKLWIFAENKILQIILLLVGVLVVSVPCGYACLLNINCLIYFL